ncbi:hypothetical protein C806_01674 [Lachnospiraceae bacterium 3-1]|nr:hypothetical protein C806_01674 [Lachnospiraceae bacterium 3-1]
MSREKFMSQLEQLLLDVSEEEKQEALSYYRSYFEDAGIENEERILKELESPEKVAATIKADLGMEQPGVGGEYTERGFEDSRFAQKNPVDIRKTTSHQQSQSQGQSFGQGYSKAERTYDYEDKKQQSGYSNESANSGDGRSTYGGRTGVEILLIVAIAIITSPIWLGLVGGVGGGLLGLAIAVVCIAGSLYVAGIALFGAGIGQIVTGSLAIGFALTGTGLLILALAVLATVLSIWVCGKLIPWICRLIGRLWNSIFAGRERMV